MQKDLSEELPLFLCMNIPFLLTNLIMTVLNRLQKQIWRYQFWRRSIHLCSNISFSCKWIGIRQAQSLFNHTTKVQHNLIYFGRYFLGSLLHSEMKSKENTSHESGITWKLQQVINTVTLCSNSSFPVYSVSE